MKKFLSCDWGTSTLRLRLADADSKEISDEFISDEGIAESYRQWLATGRPESQRIHFYKNILNRSIKRSGLNFDDNTPVICSGMASSSVGMSELPYRNFPFTWDASRVLVKKFNADKEFIYPIFLISGFKTDIDVMRGEETLLLGCNIVDEGEYIYIFPGTHSKHVFVKNKAAVDFKTYMTGEIFNLLTEKSILQHAVRKGTDEKAFEEGFRKGMQGNLLNLAFLVRTRQLLQDADTVSNYQFLSGLLIGAELSDLKNYNCPVYLVSGKHLEMAYQTGLTLMGENRKIILLDADDMLIKGQCKIAEHYL